MEKLFIFTDGAARGNPGEAGAGIHIRDGQGVLLEKAVYLGTATNNVAEYLAFLIGLREAAALGGTRLSLHSDSELLVRQLQGRYRVKDAKLQPLFEKAKKALAGFTGYEISHIRREENREADRLANRAIDERSAADTGYLARAAKAAEADPGEPA
jgi:ribonuclease HI